VSSLPAEIEDAAKVDGAGTRAILRRVVLPLIAPGAAGTSALVFLAAWGAFLVPLVFAATIQVQPLSVIIPQYTTKYATNYGLQAAAGVIALVPPVLLVLWLNRYIVEGVLRGAVKG
jgi:multiple sugar transport system permease protein